MAAFCGSCGKELEGGARFCRFCGAESGAAAPVIPSAATPWPAAASGPGVVAVPPGAVVTKKSSNTLLTVLMICVVLFVCFIGALTYAAYWAKNRAAAVAKSYGIEIPEGGRARARTSSAGSQRDPCSFITPADVATATGIAITEAHIEQHTCNFASADGTGAGAFVEFEWGNGQMLMTGTKVGSKLATMGPGTEMQSVTGVGDEAYFQNGMLSVRRGDDGFRIMLPAELLSRNLGSRSMADNIADMRDMEKGLAQKIVSKM